MNVNPETLNTHTHRQLGGELQTAWCQMSLYIPPEILGLGMVLVQIYVRCLGVSLLLTTSSSCCIYCRPPKFYLTQLSRVYLSEFLFIYLFFVLRMFQGVSWLFYIIVYRILWLAHRYLRITPLPIILMSSNSSFYFNSFSTSFY